jgi:hypothetical protein
MSGARHRRQRPEAAIHAAVCDHLRLRAKPDVLWLHPANGGTRDIREAARFKRMGVLAGASDLLFWHRGNSFALELKSPGGRLSDAQLRRRREREEHGMNSTPRPEVGRCGGCGRLTDCYIGHDVPENPFFCNRCNDEIMGWEPGFSALLALSLSEPPDDR